jgi:2-polyprenyl-6-methoxyphenol hydroxylase-like FAD-dependent oxidoreductase
MNGSRKLYHFEALRIHRITVAEELRKELKRQEIPIHFNMKRTGIKEESDQCVVVSFENDQTMEARFVIGADGIHSRVRPFIASESHPQFSGLMGVMRTVDRRNLDSLNTESNLPLPCMLFGSAGSFAIMPSSYDGEEIGYFATIESQDRSRDEWAQLDRNGAELKEMLETRFVPEDRDWPAVVKELCTKTPFSTLTSWP